MSPLLSLCPAPVSLGRVISDWPAAVSLDTPPQEASVPHRVPGWPPGLLGYPAGAQRPSPVFPVTLLVLVRTDRHRPGVQQNKYWVKDAAALLMYPLQRTAVGERDRRWPASTSYVLPKVWRNLLRVCCCGTCFWGRVLPYPPVRPPPSRQPRPWAASGPCSSLLPLAAEPSALRVRAWPPPQYSPCDSAQVT